MMALLLATCAAACRLLAVAAADPGSQWDAPALDSLPSSQVLDLCGASWRVHAVAGPGISNCSGKVSASVPGDIYTDLHAAGVIGDPLGAFGDWNTAWAGRTSWSYSRSFDVPAAQLASSGSALLVFEGVETNATIILNGQPLLNVSDSWLTYSVDVQQHLHAGSNTLEVRFASVYDVCEFSDPSHANVTCPGRVYVRQAASSWGWDWAKRFSPQGIWRPVYVAFIPRSEAAIVALGAIVRPVAEQPAAGSFTVEVRLTIHATAAIAKADIAVSGAWSGANNSISVSTALAMGENMVTLELGATDVELWWPAGYGAQSLYNLTASVTGSSMTRRLVRQRLSVSFYANNRTVCQNRLGIRIEEVGEKKRETRVCRASAPHICRPTLALRSSASAAALATAP
jgi:beta-mannosidase